jgi:hypothetical protein
MHADPTHPVIAKPPRLGPVALGVVASLALGGCMRPEVEKRVAFNSADHAAWMAKGSATITGEGFLRRPNGFLARCSGGKVFLVPASAYFREWVEIRKGGGQVANARGLDAAHESAVRTTQCDATGRFLFENLPTARWLVVTRISYEGQAWNAHLTLATEIETKAGEVANVILSNPNRI